MTKQKKTTSSAEETQEFAAVFAQELEAGMILAFYGELGAGKTCFIQGLARGLGVEAFVNSPTYTIINEYKGSVPLYHIDLYRIHGEDEALALGLDDYLYSDGIAAVEWAERAESLLPPGTIRINLAMDDISNERIITITRGDK